MRIIDTGLIAQHSLGGVTWDYLQYVLGLRRLGHDVYYIEDSGAWPYAFDGGLTGTDFKVTDCSANVAHLAEVMSRFDLSERWAYRCPIDREWSGLSDVVREEVIASTELLLNISSTVLHPDEYRSIPRLAFVDSDPVFTQIKLARGQQDFRAVVDAHDVHFSFGESLTERVPSTGHHWIPTRQPVVLDQWCPGLPHRGVFTTVMNWASYNPVTFLGRTYGQKDVEFKRFIDLPRLVKPATVEIAARGTSRSQLPDTLLGHLRYKGWHVVDPAKVCPDMDSYRDYIQNSMAEWSVAKNGYVAGAPGWFSCRSACYLAAGRPVVVQDTGFSQVLPVGDGLLMFTSPEQAVEGIRRVMSDYARHARAAREIAEEYLDSDKVLANLIDKAFAAQEVVP
ncbi:MAG: hypothetical protein ABIW30_00190 [Arenimonas sp.]